ncbi:ankyrin repeat domain-containing protein [Flavivirga aquimarina]|uniref:Ankyrin repeat domain-containing protein n=1 Tax=Flavivirga aquimarina TaxID=2027862 RepID=A0ABT8W9Q8_9FLAO|nr:ankyrin repeat domain-containing protein [Flavivirga aquimarina]MDO5969806.1 ankyrin repeat domain-containing protein [Flavivirga aquimarina]
MKKKHLLILLISYGTLHAQKNIFDVSRNGTVEEVLRLYKENPDIINSVNDSGHSPLILACYHGNEAVVKFLIEKVKDINESNDYGTPLMAAVVKGNISITKLLLDKNVDVNISDIKGTTALHYACMYQNIEMVTLLINANANYNIKNNVGKTAMDFAVATKNKSLITILKNKKP